MTDDISTQLAANLKRLRDERNLSQQGLADQSGVPRPTVAHLESGQANPTLSVVTKLARALGVTLDHLVEPEAGELRLIEPVELRMERRGKAKRMSLIPEGVGRDLLFERIELKAGGQCSIEAAASCPAVVVCERGELELTEGSRRVQVRAERVAMSRGTLCCSSAVGAIAYRMGGVVLR